MKILYICTHNRCRSILSEAITNAVSEGKLIAKSAGSQPAGEVHPATLQALTQAGYAIDGLQSQSWDAFESFDADVVITVCDSAAGESCPVWFGRAVKVHWGLADPSKVIGSDETIAAAFTHAIDEIHRRVQALCSLTVDVNDKEALRSALQQLTTQ